MKLIPYFNLSLDRGEMTKIYLCLTNSHGAFIVVEVLTKVNKPKIYRAPPKSSKPSTHPDMGAIPYRDHTGQVIGTTFRVWAPFAKAVAVRGDFNGWSTVGTPLANEENGNWSVDIKGALADHQYIYAITSQTDQILERNDPRARYIEAGKSVIFDAEFDWEGEEFTMPSWNELVIYEMHLGTFSDPNQDEEPGTLAGAVQKFSYLKDLGINAIEVMPPAEFNGKFSWGYNPDFPFAIEHALGGPQEFKKFIRAAHKLGIAVIMDVVYNHFGPEALSMWQFDGWSEDNKGGVYFYNDWRCWTPWGDTRPDFGRAEVRQFIRDNALMWLEEYRVDGLRLDATSFIRNIYGNNNDPANDIPKGWSLLQWINDEVDQRHPWKITIAEDIGGNTWLTKPSEERGAGFSSQWDISFLGRIRQTLTDPNDYARDMYSLAETISMPGDLVKRIIYTESHDEVANLKSRLPEEIWPNSADSWYSRKRSTLGAALVFTAPGIPMIFQGQELLEDRWFNDQQPMDWTKLDTFAGIHQLYRDLIGLRRNFKDHTRGLMGSNVRVHHINNYDKVIAFHRWQEGGSGDDVMIIMNFANRSYQSYTLGFPRAGDWVVRFNSDGQNYSPDFANHLGYNTQANPTPKDGMAWSANVGIGAYTALILSQEPS